MMGYLSDKYGTAAVKKNIPIIIIFVVITITLYGGLIYISLFGEKEIYRVDDIIYMPGFVAQVWIINENSGEECVLLLLSFFLGLRENENVYVSELCGIRIIQKTIVSIILLVTVFEFILYILLLNKIKLDSNVGSG